MSAPSMPPDNSAQIRSMEIEAENRRRAEDEAKAVARKAELSALKGTAAQGGRTSAADYFTSRGLDPSRHSGAIESKINSILASIPADEEAPGSYFADVGSQIYAGEETAQRGKAGRELDALFAPDFETKRLPYTVDDPYLAGLEAEQRAGADEIIRNMLERGVITQSGYNAASEDLGKQAPGVRSRLNEVGTGLIGGGQQSLRDVANRGRTAAGTLNVDQPFLASDFGSEADRLTGEFLATLGDQLRSRVTGNLFSTSGLGNVAGAAQGGQNLPFNADVLAGVPGAGEEEEEEEEAGTQPF